MCRLASANTKYVSTHGAGPPARHAYAGSGRADAGSDRQCHPIPAAKDAPSTSAVNGAVLLEMTSVNQRLFNNPYFRSVDALLLLASYRLSTLLEWLPLLAAFVMAAIADGGFARFIKAKEFRQHDPEMFAWYASLGIVVLCATVIGFVLPMRLHPLLLPCAPLVAGTLVGRALGCFHLLG